MKESNPMTGVIIGSSPLFSTLLAAVFLGEKIDAATLFGTVLVVAGIAVARSGGEGVKELRSSVLVLPIASAISYGASSVTRKAALNILPESSFGALIGAIASLTIYSTYLLVGRRTGELRVNWGAAGSGWPTGWW